MTEEQRIDEVLTVLPHLDVRRVRALLAKYGSAEEVVNRCLDGQVEDDLPGGGEEEVVELDSNTTTTTAEYDTNPFEDNNFPDGGYEDGVIQADYAPRTIEVRVDDSDDDQSCSSSNNFNNLNTNEELPDIPEMPDDEFACFQLESQTTSETVAKSQPVKAKGRGRKKKEEADEANKEVLSRVSKKKLPTNVANIEVQLGTALIDKSVSHSVDLVDALLKALEVNGGMFEKNAALPCPCSVTIWEDAPHPYALRWIYHKPVSVLDNDEESSDVVYAAPGSEFVAEIQPELCIMLPLDDFISLCRPGNNANDLSSFCRRLSSSLKGEHYHRLILIAPDPEQYFKHRQTDQRRQFRQKIVGELTGASSSTGDDVTFEDIETAIASLDFVDPPLDVLVTVSYSTTSDHAAALVRSLTKALCERPGKAAKRQWDSVLVMEPGSTVNSADKPFELWVRQLEQLSLVSGDVASAIAGRYQTPMSLHCAATAAGEPNFAADIEIRRGAGVLERTRRVGPETSRRLHMLFTTGVDPETVIE